MTTSPPRRAGYGLRMISRMGISRDSLESYAEATASSVGAVTGIVVSAASDIAAELGSLTSQVLRIRDSAARAPESDD